MENNGENTNNKNKKEYLGSRYSQQLFGENAGRVSDSGNKEMEKKEQITKELFWKASGEEDYTKEETLSKIILKINSSNRK